MMDWSKGKAGNTLGSCSKLFEGLMERRYLEYVLATQKCATASSEGNEQFKPSGAQITIWSGHDPTGVAKEVVNELVVLRQRVDDAGWKLGWQPGSFMLFGARRRLDKLRLQ